MRLKQNGTRMFYLTQPVYTPALIHLSSGFRSASAEKLNAVRREPLEAVEEGLLKDLLDK
jgi:hypothetical protein